MFRLLLVFVALVFSCFPILPVFAADKEKESESPKQHQIIHLDEIVISTPMEDKISSSGSFELNGESISREEIPGKITQLLNENKTKTLELQGDKSLNFELFGGIIGDARRAGIENFIFATQKPKSRGKPTRQ